MLPEPPAEILSALQLIRSGRFADAVSALEQRTVSVGQSRRQRLSGTRCLQTHSNVSVKLIKRKQSPLAHCSVRPACQRLVHVASLS